MNNAPEELPAGPGDSAPAAPAADPDAGWALLARAGDRTAMEKLVLRHQSEVARLLWRFARSHADLEDLVQDTFLRVVRSIHTWRSDRPFLHWLRRVTVNAGRDHCRRQAVRGRWTVEPERGDASGEANPPEAVDPAPDPAARAAANEVKRLLATLPPDDYALLTLHHLEGWGLADIARDFGWTLTATKLRAWRARARLRARLENPLSS